MDQCIWILDRLTFVEGYALSDGDFGRQEIPGEPRAVRDRPAFECLLENDLRRTSVGEGVAPAERSYLHSAKCGERGTFIDSWRARFREARGRVATGIANRSHSTADFAKGVATLPPASPDC